MRLCLHSVISFCRERKNCTNANYLLGCIEFSLLNSTKDSVFVAVPLLNIFLNYEKLIMPHSVSVKNISPRETFPLCSEDKADVVGFLKRMLQQRTDSITELTDRLEGMKVRMEGEKDRMEKRQARREGHEGQDGGNKS
jgi:hypothetical protein